MTKSKSKSKSQDKKLRITTRVVNVKRHTQGYVISGRTYSVAQTRSMVSRGRINGVQVVGQHIQAVPGSQRLADLPVRVRK